MKKHKVNKLEIALIILSLITIVLLSKFWFNLGYDAGKLNAISITKEGVK